MVQSDVRKRRHTDDPGLRSPLEKPTRAAGFRRGLSVIQRPEHPVYMVRWLVARIFGWEFKFNLFLASDADCLHDHPWPFLSIMLAGSYTEITEQRRHHYDAPCILYRPARWTHRIEISEPCLTFNVSAPRVRNWGFHTLAGWIPWAKYNEGDHKC